MTQPDGERASIHAIEYHLGERKAIDDLDFLRDDPKRLELYKLGGFEYYAASTLSMRELARRSAAATLESSGIDRDDVGVLIYVAESDDRDEPVRSFEVNHLLLELGLDHAVPIHVSVSNCANIVSALRVAAAFIEAGETQHVLIASVDKASNRYGGRRMFQEMSIKSDISVSCLVSSPGVGPYGITGLHQQNLARLVDLVDSANYAMEKFKGIRRVAKVAKERLSLTAGDFARIITNNYSREVMKMFIELCGFPKHAGCFGNIGRFAHAVAGDVLINLRDLDDDGAIRSGDRIFLMADSVTASSVFCLRKH
jgi:3-oxoacyl-[acyl-carrier-protein] synthase III